MLNPTEAEETRRKLVRENIKTAIEANTRIELPRVNEFESQPSTTALLTAGIEANPYGASIGLFRYQFEGEEDLLHLFVVRQDQTEIHVEEARQVALWLLPGLEPGHVWLKPGEFSQHFYFGHEAILSLLG